MTLFSGSGKTAAFLLPIMNRILHEGPYGQNYGVSLDNPSCRYYR